MAPDIGQGPGDPVEVPRTVADLGRYVVLTPGSVAPNGFMDYIDIGFFPYQYQRDSYAMKLVDADHADVQVDPDRDTWLRLKIEHGDPVRIIAPLPGE